MIFLRPLKNVKTIAIYEIRDTISKRSYIGNSVEVVKRWESHFDDLTQNKHANKFLQNAYNKHVKENQGNDDFLIFRILEELPENSTDSFIHQREEYWIQRTPKVFNFLLYPTKSYVGYPTKSQNANDLKSLQKQFLNMRKTQEYQRKSDATREKISEKKRRFWDVKIQSPDGQIFGPFDNLKAFAEEQDLNYNILAGFLNKKRPYMRGWKIL